MIVELKEYFPKEGCFDALAERFQRHTLRIFKKLEIECMGAWVSGEDAQRSLVYLTRFHDEEDMRQKWRAFSEEAEWLEIKKESERPSGPLMASQTSRILLGLQADDA